MTLHEMKRHLLTTLPPPPNVIWTIPKHAERSALPPPPPTWWFSVVSCRRPGFHPPLSACSAWPWCSSGDCWCSASEGRSRPGPAFCAGRRWFRPPSGPSPPPGGRGRGGGGQGSTGVTDGRWGTEGRCGRQESAAQDRKRDHRLRSVLSWMLDLYVLFFFERTL